MSKEIDEHVKALISLGVHLVTGYDKALGVYVLPALILDGEPEEGVTYPHLEYQVSNGLEGDRSHSVDCSTFKEAMKEFKVMCGEMREVIFEPAPKQDQDIELAQLTLKFMGDMKRSLMKAFDLGRRSTQEGEKDAEQLLKEMGFNNFEHYKNSRLTHQSHCCLKHGCKYGDRHCVVVNEFLKQHGPCEECAEDMDP